MGTRTASFTAGLLLGAALLLAASCTSDGPTSSLPGRPPSQIVDAVHNAGVVRSAPHSTPVGVLQGRRVASVTISPATTTANVGCIIQLTGSALDAGGNPVSIPVTWSSNNTAVARVDQTGLVTGVSSGSATISGSAQGKRSTAMIAVMAAAGSGTLCIQIDATALTASNFGVSGVGSFPTISALALRLSPGGYALTAADGEVLFDVTLGGVVDYAPVLEGVLTGRGTATLRAAGAPVTIDATGLSAATFLVSGVVGTTYSTAAPQALRLLPNIDAAHPYALAAADGEVAFEVTPAGTVDYAPALEGVLTGKGTATLRAAGAPVTIDATGLSAATFVVSGVVGTTYSTSAPQSLRLLPNIDAAHPYALAAADGEVVFEVTPAGTVDYDAALEGVLTGKGTTTLRAAGVGITIDAIALGPSSSFSISGIGPFSTAAPVGLRLLSSIDPYHAYGFASAALSFPFVVTQWGLLDYDHSLDSRISGRGTNTLTIM